MPGGFAAGVAFPATESEVAALVSAAARVLPVGAQSSLTGGATPRGDVVLSTRALARIGPLRDGRIRVGAGVPVSALQAGLGSADAWYPPAPTYDGAFVGGTIATNAAGAATFKYGSTRSWVEALTVVLADGNVLDVERGAAAAAPGERFEIVCESGAVVTVPVPTYVMPRVAKLSAGYYAIAPLTDLVDVFVGSEGTLGVIVEATLRVVPRPARCIALVRCPDDARALAVTALLRDEARAAWRGEGPLDVSAIEYIDSRSLRILSVDDFARAGVKPPQDESAILLVHIEMRGGEDASLERLNAVLESGGADADTRVAMPRDERAAGQLLGLREAVPAAVNAAVGAAQARVDPEIQKTAADMVVPFDRVAESLAIYRAAFERRGLEYAIWGHLSDGNLHPNVIPRSRDDVERGREAIVEIARRIMALGGAPLAEHGVGRNALKQQLLVDLYGAEGVDQMRAVKRALDPTSKLSPGVLFA